MRPVVKLVKPTSDALLGVQQRMRCTPYFTRNEVKLWFEELDLVLGPINAGRAADALLADLRHRGVISCMGQGRGWNWRKIEAAEPIPGAATARSEITDAAAPEAPAAITNRTFSVQMREACEVNNVSFGTEYSWWPSIEFYLRRAGEAVHHHNARWWQDIRTGERLTRNVPEMLMLVVSEIAEAMEGHRKNLMDDKLPHRPMLEVELADAMIRILDLAAGLKLDLAGALVEKVRFNTTRADHTPEARLAAGGKAY